MITASVDIGSTNSCRIKSWFMLNNAHPSCDLMHWEFICVTQFSCQFASFIHFAVATHQATANDHKRQKRRDNIFRTHFYVLNFRQRKSGLISRLIRWGLFVFKYCAALNANQMESFPLNIIRRCQFHLLPRTIDMANVKLIPGKNISPSLRAIIKHSASKSHRIPLRKNPDFFFDYPYIDWRVQFLIEFNKIENR